MFLILYRLLVYFSWGNLLMVLDLRLAARIATSIFGTAKTVAKGVAPEIRALGCEASVFSNPALSTNPLVMDAKATFAKLNINSGPKTIKLGGISKKFDTLLGIEPKSEYQIFEEKVFQEACSTVKAKNEEVLIKINPIKLGNIDSIRSELTSLLENAELRQKISACPNPDELFGMIKSNISEILKSKKYIEFMEKVSKTEITPELEKEYSQLYSSEAKRIDKIMSILKPKSTNSEVLKIEEEVRNLGVQNVNFSDDLEQAKSIKEAMEDLIKKGIPLPASVKVSHLVPSGQGGVALHVQEGGHMWLPTSAEKKALIDSELMAEDLIKDTDAFKTASIEDQKKCLNELINKRNTHHSTKNSNHLIFHEVAHTFQPNSLASRLRELTDEEMKTAAEISIYAKRNGREAMAEMFAKLMDGQSLTDKQMKLYLKLGGIVPKV